MTKKIFAADLFCGAGGTSAGLLKAARQLGLNVELVAINHWDVAIATHSLNHPGVRHVNSDLEKVDPRLVVPGGKLDLLVASPECTHFSKARGGKPMSKQSRASVKYILRWVGALDVKNVIIENVAEFMDWGPLHRKGPNIDKPIQNRKGEYFHRFIRKMQDHGYLVKWRVLNAADYGDPTTRKRLFVMACKGHPPVFPEATHRQHAGDMFGNYKTWKPAREIIDWSIKGESIFKRKKPLSPNTMRRIMAGLMKFGGKAFVIGQQSGAAPRGVDQPVPTIAAAGAISFIEPFIVTTNWTATNRSLPRSVDDPIPAVTGQGQIGLVQPFLIPYHTENGKQKPRSHSVDNPLPTVRAGGVGFGLVEPFVVMLNDTSDTHLKSSIHSVEEPLPTITGAKHCGIAQPFIMPVNHGKDLRTHSLNDPMPTVTSVDAWSLIEPFIVQMDMGGSVRSVNEPMNTLTSADARGLVEPFLVEYYGTGGSTSVDEPLKTQTSRDRFGLVQPMTFEHDGKTYVLDIRFRMLQPHELARAMSFPKKYKFHGTREQVVKQIGNAVPVELASALCSAQLAKGLR